MLKNNLYKKFVPFAEILSSGINFINILIMMQLLSIEQFADYSYVVTIVLWLSSLMDFGVSNVIFNKGVQNKTENIDTLLSSRFVTSLIVLTLISIYFLAFHPYYALNITIYTVFIFFNSTSSILKMLMRSKQHYFEDVKIILLEPVFKLLFIISLLLFKVDTYNLWHFLLGYMILSVIACLINLNSIKKHILVNPFKKMGKGYLKNTFQTTKHYILYYFILIALYRIDIIFMEKYSTKNNMAFYQTAKSLLDVLQLFLFTFITSYFINIYKNPKKYFILISIFLVFTIFITNFSSEIVYSVLFPIKYHNQFGVLNFLILSAIPYFFTQFIIAKLNFENNTKYVYLLLTIPLFLKILLYSVFQESELSFYYKSYTYFEYFTMLILYFSYLHIKNKSKKTI